MNSILRLLTTSFMLTMLLFGIANYAGSHYPRMSMNLAAEELREDWLPALQQAISYSLGFDRQAFTISYPGVECAIFPGAPADTPSF